MEFMECLQGRGTVTIIKNTPKDIDRVLTNGYEGKGGL